ncbi:MAG TPA: ankyrin repeat domain-containing protein [Pyrinomonadaceae bacterium]|jgi:predicted pyridoxine 5'-phosphate oxidase superfamily flavin-nucleotide-binding protein
MNRATLLDRLTVARPCAADWAAMRGNERVRFCEHCALHVHNLAGMTRPEALKVVARARGRICVRYERRPDGTPATRTPLVQINRGVRRASRLAAGAFSAALSLAAAAVAQTPAADEPAAATTTEQTQTPAPVPWPYSANGGDTLAGTVTDPAGALIPNVTVTLVEPQSGATRTATTDDGGGFTFAGLAAGKYNLQIDASGFKRMEVRAAEAGAGRQPLTISLQIGEVVEMGVVVISEPEEPLVLAAYKGDLLAVRGLLAVGADVNVRDKLVDKTALMEAVSADNLELVRLLVGARADANRRNEYGQTALMLLGPKATPELVHTLTGAGARVNAKDKDGETALMYAARWGNAETVRALTEAGARVDARNHDGQTALMLAATVGELENVRALLAAGADMNRRDHDGDTAASLAKAAEHEEVLKLLLTYGAYIEPDRDEQP